MKQARLVVYKSENGRDGWMSCMADEVPEFVKRPEVMGRLVAGEQCMDVGEGDSGSAWYRALRVMGERQRHALERRLH